MVKNMLANAGDIGSIPGPGRFPWRRKCQSTPVFSLGKFYIERNLLGYSPYGPKLSDTTENTHMHINYKALDYR